ncbi:MAG: hypothetical protein J6Y27_00460 [Bacteroidales bacterium]|nr:hypothetical protein [Bacteroidales bacterium]
MLKQYGIYGQTQAVINFPINDGQAWFTAEFGRGRIGAGIQNRPATYTTANPVIQAIIENSKEFGHLIKIVRVTEDSEEKKAAAPNAPALAAHPEIASKEDAVAFLKQNGAKATQLKDDESIRKYAEKIGVFFPNLY